ncbi:MAG: NADH-quinone oxidoreductase subunit C [Candidatus Korarchaeum sp.]|nr:NADH-quinone oxidoreductase subunit C [Candidatus Korarchaeum sp.]MDW8036234.1 NADH-quinone oxidoreductase subunit C [Candidatus Korarchaeum sp.]
MKVEDLRKEVEVKLSGLGAEVSSRDPNVVEVRVSRERVVEVAIKLREMGMDHVKAVTAIDYPNERLEVVYITSSYSSPDISYFLVNLRISLPYEDPRMPSLTQVWPSVLYQEQEEHDLLGVHFEGNPRMGERLLLPENYTGIPPLRKEFKVRTEGIDA